jgi:phenylpropionate dioxygenase-like ring-hydroxylating dioxygenase large terminal subunit
VSISEGRLDPHAALRSENGDGGGHAAPDQHAQAERLLGLLREYAARPLDEGQALPGEMYTSPAIYELELERIFRRDWLFVGRADEIADPGDWLSATIGDEPIMIVRGEDREVRALSRVCPHRFMDVLADGSRGDHGHRDSFVCPYHSWAFGLDGKMTGAPMMSKSKRFEREHDSYCLSSFKTEVWNGFVFVNLDPDAEPLAPRMGEIEEITANYDLADWVQVDRVDWPESPANWKLVMDNGRECYHHQGAHKETLEPLWPANMVDADTTDSKYWYYQRMFVSPEMAVGQEEGHLQHPLVLPAFEGLSAFDRSQYLLIGVYPSMFFACGPDMLITGKWLPTGPASHKFELGICVHKSQLDDPDLKEKLAESVQWAHDLQVEDSRMITGIQSMLESRHAQRGGALQYPLERPMWQFQQYLAHRLLGDGSTDGDA